MIELTGRQTLPLPPNELWHKLADARFLIDHVPDLKEKKEVTSERAEGVLAPGFAFVRGKLDVCLQVTESVEPNLVRFSLTSKGIGTSSDAEARLELTEQDETSSLVSWSVKITRLGGLLKAVPKGLIRGAAEKVISSVWDQIETSLTEETTKTS